MPGDSCGFRLKGGVRLYMKSSPTWEFHLTSDTLDRATDNHDGPEICMLCLDHGRHGRYRLGMCGGDCEAATRAVGGVGEPSESALQMTDHCSCIQALRLEAMS